MRNPRTRRRWQHVLGLVLVLALTPMLNPLAAFADSGTTPVPTVAPTPSGVRVVSQDVNLWIAPDDVSDVITVIPVGSTVTLTGSLSGLYAQVLFGDATGWVIAEYLLENVDGTGAPTVAPTTTVTAPPVETDGRVLTEDVNLRAEPDPEAQIVAVLSAGTSVDVTGEVSSLYAEVTSAQGEGWVVAQYLKIPGTTPSPTVVPTETATGTSAATETVTVAPTESATTTETAVPTVPVDSTVTVVPSETAATTETVTPTETTAPTSTGEATATATASVTTVPTETTAPTVAPSETATIPPSENSLVIWPVSGGQWEISQGYNGSSHQNRDSLWQYRDSFDIVPTNGETTGQQVYSPVNGTIRWFDPSTGGISIDMGGGYAFAIFHIDVDPNLQVGQTLTQGQGIGTIAGPGGGGNGGFPHLHMTVWATSDGGNWDRQSIPFTGAVAVNGVDFPNTGTSYEHSGYIFNP